MRAQKKGREGKHQGSHLSKVLKKRAWKSQPSKCTSKIGCPAGSQSLRDSWQAITFSLHLPLPLWDLISARRLNGSFASKPIVYSVTRPLTTFSYIFSALHTPFRLTFQNYFPVHLFAWRRQLPIDDHISVYTCWECKISVIKYHTCLA